MRQIQMNESKGPDALYLGSGEARDPAPGEVRVRIAAACLNYHDYAVVIRMLKTPVGRIPLSDGAGVVEAVGEGVRDLKVGDRVMSLFFPNWNDGPAIGRNLRGVPGDHVDGFAADAITASAAMFTRAPANLTLLEAATLPCAALTAWRALMVETAVRPGDWVLVQGTGGVSLFALQFAKLAGARVIATSSSDEKLKRLKELGADVTINYRTTPEWGAAAVAATNGIGVDLVVEVGGAGTLPQSIIAARIGGCISLIGVLAGVSGDIPTSTLMGKNITLSGITVGSRAHQLDMTRAIEANDLHPIMDQVFPLEETADAFRHMESGRHFGKIMVRVSDAAES